MFLISFYNDYIANYKKDNKYNLTKKDKGYVSYTLNNDYETTWTLMRLYGLPLNYLSIVRKRKSWIKYEKLLDNKDFDKMKQRRLLYEFKRL